MRQTELRHGWGSAKVRYIYYSRQWNIVSEKLSVQGTRAFRLLSLGLLPSLTANSRVTRAQQWVWRAATGISQSPEAVRRHLGAGML